MNWYFETLKQYVLSGGQVPTSRESGLVTLFVFIISCVLSFVGILVGGPVFVVVLIGLCGSAMLIPGIALSAIVLNNANRSGWWLLISFMPLIGSIILLGFIAQDNQSKENQGGCDPEDAAA